MVLLTTLLVTSLFGWALCYYRCLCNYNVKLPIMNQSYTVPIGYMYEFDCLPVVVGQTTNVQAVVMFNHQMGYLQTNAQTQIQTCPGDPSTDHILTTLPRAPATTTHTPRTTIKPTKQQAFTPFPSTSNTLALISTVTTLPRATATTTHTPRTTKQQAFTPFPPTSTLTTSNTLATISTGNGNSCPSNLHQVTTIDQGVLERFGDNCFEIVPTRMTWSKAEKHCTNNGGHLFHVETKEVQHFITTWMKSYDFDYAVWTGLNDLNYEDYFEWITGDHLLYTNWYPDAKGDLASHYKENCVLLIPYAPYNGQWDDVQCGITTQFGDSGQQNPFICEYPLHQQSTSSHSLQLVGR